MSRNVAVWIIVAMSLAVAGTRPFLPVIPLDLTPMSLYKDTAHIFVGVIFGLFLAAALNGKKEWKLFLGLFVLLAAVETLAVLRRGM